MARTVIIGAGVTGNEIARRVEDPVIIESDADKVAKLKRELGDIRVVMGDGTQERTLLQAGISEAETLVISLGDDKASYQAVLNAKPYKNLKKIIVIVKEPREVAKFQRLGVQSVVIPALATASAVLSVLKPTEKRILEVVITRGAEAIGKRLDNISLPWNTEVIGVMRHDRLKAATSDLELEPMDVVHVSAELEDMNAVRNVFLGDHSQLLPFQKLMVPVLDLTWLETEFKETIQMGMFCQSGVVAVFGKETEGLMEMATQMAEGMGVPFHALLGYDIDFESLEDAMKAASTIDLDALVPVAQDDIVEVIKKERSEAATHVLPEGDEVEVDLLVLRAEIIKMADRLGKRPICIRAAEETNVPMLVARNPEPYASVLFMLDGSPRSNNIASLALRTSIAFGSKMTALTTLDQEHQEAQRMLKHIQRTAEMYGLDLVEDIVEGNPTLEFVTLVKSGDNDLTLVNRACKTVKRDIIRRVYMEAPKSVMVV
jgi:Trk K+ transport system NAD-binding subunit